MKACSHTDHLWLRLKTSTVRWDNILRIMSSSSVSPCSSFPIIILQVKLCLICPWVLDPELHRLLGCFRPVLFWSSSFCGFPRVVNPLYFFWWLTQGFLELDNCFERDFSSLEEELLSSTQDGFRGLPRLLLFLSVPMQCCCSFLFALL